MAGSTRTPNLTVLLCLGLCRGPWDQVQADVLPTPSIWADPGPMISKGSSVTIWCQRSLQGDGYVLYKDRGSEPSDVKIPQASSNKTGFLIQSMSSQHAGLYQCAYSTGGTLSERSEPLLLVVTGEHSAPSLSAQPGPVVASGGNMSLLCSSQSTLGPFHLLKEGGAETPECRTSEWNYSARRWQAVFPVGPVSSSHGGTYRCYGSSSSDPNIWSQPSVPLHLEVTGVHMEPSLSAKPGPLLLPGDSLTLQCHSEPSFHRFALTKDEGSTHPQRLHGQHSPNFPLGPVSLSHGGRYRCYSGHNLSHVWSAPSAPLDILIAGMSWKPSLSAHPGPSVPWGVNVTLQCGSEVRADTFHLHREGSLDPPQQLRLQDTAAPSQANFTISPVAWSHNGTYRCYSSNSSSPFQLSEPSDPLELVVSGVPPKPSIWADPGPRVSKGSSVTIWCQGSLQGDGYLLYKERGSQPLDTSIPQASSNKTGFLIQSMRSQYTGLYQCAYSTGGMLSERSEPLVLVVTGEHSAPSLSAQPGPVVASGGNMSLLCSSQSSLDTVYLLKEGGAETLQPRKSERRSYERRWQAVFPVGPVSSSHGGTYRCYGSSSSNPSVWSQPSDPLHLKVTGVYRKPSLLSAQPGPLLLPGDNLTLQCHSEPGFDRFALTKEEGTTPPRHLHGQQNPNFPLGPVNLSHGGRYRCYSGHNLSYVWSAPSAPLDILIVGKDSKPSLSAQPGPSVPWGANVTLQCESEVRADTFHLHREGSLDPPQQLHLQDTAAPSQANFTISPVTWSHYGTYRCYSSHSSSPFQLSQPSDPLELLVSAQGLQWSLNVLIGVSVALVLLLSLLLILLFQHWRQTKGRTSDAALMDPQPGEVMELNPQQNEPSDNSKGVTYAQVNRRSRLRQGTATSPSHLSEEVLDRKGRQAEEDRQMDSQAAASADPQDATYTQLSLMTLRGETSAPPSSPSRQPPDEPSVYAALAIH